MRLCRCHGRGNHISSFMEKESPSASKKRHIFTFQMKPLNSVSIETSRGKASQDVQFSVNPHKSVSVEGWESQIFTWKCRELEVLFVQHWRRGNQHFPFRGNWNLAMEMGKPKAFFRGKWVLNNVAWKSDRGNPLCTQTHGVPAPCCQPFLQKRPAVQTKPETLHKCAL